MGISYLSVCSGIEAATQAWHPLGWNLAAVAEIDPFPCHVLRHRHGAGRPLFMPDPAEASTFKDRRARAAAIKSVVRIPEGGAVPNFGDINQFHRWPDAAIDLLVGGTPCQSFSVAGLRQGLADPRGNLALVYLAIADRYRPRWVVWENVPGVLSSGKGRDFGSFLGGMAELGYGFAYRVLDAQHVRTRRFGRAVPQRRRRVFVVGYLGDWRRAAAVLFDRESMRGNPAPGRQSGEAVAALTANGVGTCGADDNQGQAGHLIASTGDVAHCLNADGMGRQDYETETMVAHSLRGEGFDAPEDGPGRGTPIVPVAFDCKGTQVQHDQTGSTPTLRAMGHAESHANAGGQLAVAFAENSRAELRLCGGDGQVSSQLTTGGGKPGQGHATIAMPWAVRRLTPRECERLQGFPDDFTLIPVGNKLAADGPRYKALGNSMAVNVMDWLGQRIAMVDDL